MFYYFFILFFSTNSYNIFYFIKNNINKFLTAKKKEFIFIIGNKNFEYSK